MSYNPQNYKFLVGQHHMKSVIFVQFPNNMLLHKELRERFPYLRWSTTKRAWYLPDTNAVRIDINKG